LHIGHFQFSLLTVTYDMLYCSGECLVIVNVFRFFVIAFAVVSSLLLLLITHLAYLRAHMFLVCILDP